MTETAHYVLLNLCLDFQTHSRRPARAHVHVHLADPQISGLSAESRETFMRVDHQSAKTVFVKRRARVCVGGGGGCVILPLGSLEGRREQRSFWGEA